MDTVQEIADFFRDKRNIVATVVLVILVAALPVGVNLVKQIQTFFSQASGEDTIVLADGGECVVDKEKNEIKCGKLPLKLTSPYGLIQTIPSSLPSESPSQSTSPIASPSAQSMGPSSLSTIKNLKKLVTKVAFPIANAQTTNGSGTGNSDSNTTNPHDSPGDGGGNGDDGGNGDGSGNGDGGGNGDDGGNGGGEATECADNQDNDNDGASDNADSHCHSDGNPQNAASYTSHGTSEGDEHPAGCSDSKDNDNDSKIDGGDPECHTNGDASDPTTYDSHGASESYNEVFTKYYKLAETESGLNSAPELPYTEHPLVTNFDLSDVAAGAKQVWVEFADNNNRKHRDHISLTMQGPPSQVMGLNCTLDIGKSDLKITVKGNTFGNSSGKVTANGEDIDILEWKNDQIVGILKKPKITIDDGAKFTVKVIRKDNQSLEEQICRVNTSMIALGAQVFCRAPGKFDQQNIKVVLVDETRTKVEETVSIDKEGVIQGLKTILQSGKKYAISIKAPYSIRRTAFFTGQGGTTVVTTSDGKPFILPVGDIAPTHLPDGKINSADRAEIIRQWRSLSAAASQLTADFNRDTKVNSIDWACMRYDFNAEDNSIPDNPIQEEPVSSPAPSTQVSPTPAPSISSLTAKFSVVADKTTVSQNEEFSVLIRVRSDVDAANLFAANISFPADKLEVVSVDKTGSFASSWTEEFFDNATGEISMVAGVPNPGYKTGGSDGTLVTIKMKAKSTGSAGVSLLSGSQVYRNSDNTEILDFSPQTLNITIQ